MFNYIFWLALIMGALIHEFAHFIVAKLYKCQVTIFSIGLGRAIYQKKIGNTIYQLAWIPLGGFCNLKNELIYSDDKYDFPNLPYHQKLAITLAGIVANLILGGISLFIGLKNNNFNIMYFGMLNLLLGITNIIPFAPCVDGGYAIYLPICFKIWGKEKGLKIFAKSVKISLQILIILSIITLPFLIFWRIR